MHNELNISFANPERPLSRIGNVASSANCYSPNRTQGGEHLRNRAEPEPQKAHVTTGGSRVREAYFYEPPALISRGSGGSGGSRV
jgi:hypothetical protein